MITALTRYYYRLAAQEDRLTGEAKVPSYGFSEEKIGWVLELDSKGNLVNVISNLTEDKKPKPKLMSVPRPEKRTSGIKPNFLWDKTAYVLGIESNPDKATAKDQPINFAEKTFEAFKQYHLDLLADSNDEGLMAIRNFLQQWQPTHFAESICPREILDANVVFKLVGTSGYIHQREAAQTLWTSLLINQSDNAEKGLCLISGKLSPIQRTHPPIKGVFGGQSSGGSIISFNKESFTSFGKEQGSNAPVSEQAAFAYTTALNYLLRTEKHRLTIGDASTVFWAEADNTTQAEAAEGFFAALMTPPDDEQENQKIFEELQKISKGRPLAEISPELSENTRFYVLGLAPNAARISVRFWLDTTFGQLAKNLSEHWQDLALEPCPWKTPPSIWRLLLQTASLGKSENISPVLAGEMARAVISGHLYPMSLLSQLVTRIRADGDINGLRVALMKAVLQRKFRKGFIKEGVPMSLNKESDNQAYLLGRLFAVLERIQSQALGELNAGIADRYYGSASAVPFSVFPRLLSGAKHHLSRLRKDKGGMAVNLDKDLGEIIASLPENFPRHLSIDEQGRFAIGYYHQKQSYFAKKETTESIEN
ncbi:TPA: type I-C CRISPR-associated protein Cas8c/Csd1 [Mannheimia haemolytica]|uniref:Type I-C CRISPR-associated protein Cas8c/Csd1 n=1 Tax=Mannheimia haemolytica TaxID=75985 RepID=A0A547EAV5_MANHA|nr:type I-C CRISPR-associated protein Cas8c/Csd1 [Mannheimia haemolytica]AWW71488.1 type I-C CRISPR-associated protein Cas8c/Csd1 [Pasteurellaceae bacterium 12565]AGI32649.2 type I-C CRISPR-associated protein Cas8c/Csd1 [Mannheimia haemolytica USDA-ARS-USMARC-183]ASW36050.1 type I-C CRISPR-associated protein Cas8c/Csd1 [Mannheimia haemolytica]ASW65871.1 type I-C CRISPR-associated protein Cas8c/Csd1 [Mannheimia haemolytica]ASW68954.1 type I-C CRISPR-associated protein Cas8c/Csd1 [Mannheimia hae